MSASQRRVLVVDDEPNIRTTLRAVLEAAGFAVTDAADGETAVASSASGPLDLVLLDLRLPGIDGLETLTRLRAAHPALPVVLLTAHGTIDTAVEAMHRGAADFLQKPFTPERLRETVERVLAGDAEKRSYDDLVEGGAREFESGSLDPAESLARRALPLAPRRPEAVNLLGAVAEARHRRYDAIAYYRAALELDPTFPPARDNLERMTGSWPPPPVSLRRTEPRGRA